jgi:hypothetical protein
MSKQPDPWRDLANELVIIKKDLADLRKRSPFFGTGMHPNGADGIDSDNFVPDVSGYRLAETPEFNDIKLRGGIIGDDALENPVAFGFAGNSTGPFSLTTSPATKATATIAIPVGYSRALVHVTANASAQNTTGGTDAIYVAAEISTPGGPGGSGGEALSTTPAAGVASASASAGGSYVGIGTGVITIRCNVHTAFGSWSSAGSNLANVDGTVIFLR